MAGEEFTIPVAKDGSVKIPGTVVGHSWDEVLSPMTDEERRQFQQELDAIDEAERQAAVEGRSVVLRDDLAKSALTHLF